MNLDRARLQLDGLALPSQVIGPLALHLNSGILRWNLLDQAGELRQKGHDRFRRGPEVTGSDHTAFGVVGVALFAPGHGEAIALAAIHYERDRLGGLADRDRQSP